MVEKEIAKEIVLSMIQSNKLSLKAYNAINKDLTEINAFNVQEVCKAYKTVFEAVLNPKEN